ncbi:Fanconi anemia group M protein [Mixophyes fleayi]|uniref:Fanconi anemia group M protein n=1 Tax=Mixophyes fleayi TaxID=3061075 RepID=UPI003F4DD615
MNGKQRTLFQTWGSGVVPEPKNRVEPLAKKSKAKTAKKGRGALSQGPPDRATPPFWHSAGERNEGGDDTDDDLLVAVYEAEKTFNQTVTHGSHHVQDPPAPQSFGTCSDFPVCPPSRATEIQNLPGFDLSAGHIWIYPTNCPVREYQLNIAHTALLHNTLVCLPTGLGKTFIAAVVMYNFYRWYPSGKVVFMAPTKPLVAQQIESCFRVMGIPQGHMVELTGSTQAQTRIEIWKNHRVFFLTPQIMVNDLTRGACPASDIKCLVIDEAHKALGNHAYCQVVRELSNYTTQFRILALSATPGSDTKSVQQVITNLLIGRIELRSEDSPDIQPYSHDRHLEKFVVPLGGELEAVQKSYLKVLETVAGRLIQNNVLMRREIPNLTKYQIILSRDQFRKNPPNNIGGVQIGMVEGDFALCISLYHGYELLLQMGTRSLYYYLRSIMDGSKGMTRARNELCRNSDFMNLYQQLESMFSAANCSDVKKTFIYSHPKLKKLEEVVVQHFKSWNKQGPSTSSDTSKDTRIMIFSSFRDSVQEIAEMLNQHRPTVRVMSFMGHSSAGKGTKGFTQKEQLEVVKRFREGGYNTLVSTCVGEEGLDIGEVDLIICFDAQKSPIRLVQRMGRTGRKRQGRIVVILCKGREERTYNQSQSNKRSIYKAIVGNNTFFQLHHQSPRMVPDGLNPTVHKMFITQPSYDAKDVPKDRRSSLVHRKSSVFYTGEGKSPDNMKDWPLTPAEIETWKRLYRLKESDGITDVTLPKAPFGIYRDADTSTDPVPGNVCELSLSEWKLWQNRALPTHAVDHSVRCKNFIAVMELIEQMRLEENGCNYDLEMKSFLHKEDVQPSKKGTMNSEIFSVSNSKPARKLPLLKKQKACRSRDSVSMIEYDEDFRSVSKISLSTKSCPTEHANTGSVADGSEAEEAGVAEGDLNLGDGNRMEIEGCGEVTKNPPDLPGKSLTNGQSTVIKSPGKSDSGYHSFTEDPTSLLSNLFYTSSTHNGRLGVFTEFANDHIDELRQMLSRVKTFLTYSPPPLSELDPLHDIDLSTGYLPIKLSSLPLERPWHPLSNLQGSHNPTRQPECLDDGTCPTKVDIPEREPFDNVVSASPHHGYVNSQCNVETNDTNELGEGAQNDPHWDDIFDCDDEETEIENIDPATTYSHVQNQDHIESNETDIEDFGFPKTPSPIKNHGEIESNKRNTDNVISCSQSPFLNQNMTKGDDTDIDIPGVQRPIQKNNTVESRPQLGENELHSVEDSFDLFEDEAFAEIDQLSSYGSCTGNKPNNGRTSVNFNMFDLSALTEDNSEQPEKTCLDSYENKQHLDDDDELYGSRELFSVNFDLGFSFENDELSEGGDFEDGQPVNECGVETKHCKAPSPPKRNIIAGGIMSTPVASGIGNPTFGNISERQISQFSPLQSVKDKLAQTPEKSRGSSSFLTPSTRKLKNPETSFNSIAEYDLYTPTTQKTGRRSVNSPLVNVKRSDANPQGKIAHSITIGSSPESEDDVVFRRKRKLTTGSVLKSPEGASSDCDFDSPLPVAKKRRHVFNTIDSDDDQLGGLQKDVRSSKHTKKKKLAARQFIDDEAQLSSEEAEFVSSDEIVESENEQNTSLVGFLNDNTQLSQGLNDSEMHGIYLKSVRSPAVGNRFKLTHKRHSMAVFSQIPEQDESYMEDSFCVEEEDETEENDESSSTEEVQVDVDLLQQDSFVEGRRQYCTRRRLKLKGAHRKQTNEECPAKKKRRIIIHDDSSDEETDAKVKSPPPKSSNLSCSTKPLLNGSSIKNKDLLTVKTNAFDVPLRDRCQKRINLQASLSDQLDFQAESRSLLRHETPNGITHFPDKTDDSVRNLSSDSTWVGSCTLNTARSPASDMALCILADSREISSGPEVISFLKTTHGVRVDICSLGGCDYIVSNRLSVERKSQSEFSNIANRSKMVERIQHLHGMFERICLIVEKDRVKPGETSRLFQRTKYYDSTLSSLTSAGVQILFSSSQEETAALLKELTSLERRKNTGISVPTQVTSHKQEALNFYLSIPNVSYITALNLCQLFSSVRQMTNSSVDEIASRGQVSRQKAEEIYRYLHYLFDPQMLPSSGRRKQSLL